MGLHRYFRIPRRWGVRRVSNPRRFLPWVEAAETRLLLSTGFEVTISEPSTSQSVTIQDNGTGDSSATTGTIIYSTPVGNSPFTDFSVSGLTVISNSSSLSAVVATLTQQGTIVRTTSTGGNQTLVITATDDGFTTPTNLQTLTSSNSTTFTACVTSTGPPVTTASNYTSSFQSTVAELDSPFSSVTLPAVPGQATLASNGAPTNSPTPTSMDTPSLLSEPFSLTNVYTLNFDPATSNSTSMVVLGATHDLALVPTTPPTITKTADPTTAAPGGTVTYTYTVSNPSSTTMTNIDVYDDLGIPGNPNPIIIPPNGDPLGTTPSIASLGAGTRRL